MISLTEIAANKIRESIKVRGKGIGIRVGVRTAGCSGMAYVLEFVDEVDMWVEEFKHYGVSIFANSKDMTYLTGLQIDWQRQGLNEGFVFINPNEKGKCGCGESFTV